MSDNEKPRTDPNYGLDLDLDPDERDIPGMAEYLASLEPDDPEGMDARFYRMLLEKTAHDGETRSASGWWRAAAACVFFGAITFGTGFGVSPGSKARVRLEAWWAGEREEGVQIVGTTPGDVMAKFHVSDGLR